MTDQSTYYQPDVARVAAKVMDGEAVIINLETGTYYSLRDAGSRIWELMEAARSLEEIAAVLAREYDVAQAQAAQDARALFQQLEQEQLVARIAPRPEAAEPAVVAAAARASAQGLLPYQAPALEVYRDMQDLLALDPPMPGLKDIPWK